MVDYILEFIFSSIKNQRFWKKLKLFSLLRNACYTGLFFDIKHHLQYFGGDAFL